MPFKDFSFPADLISGTGRYQSWMVALTMPTENVQQMLPDELELAPQDVTPAGTHPLLLMFGHQMDVEIHLGPTEMFDMDYLEFVLEVPYTQWKAPTDDYRGPFLFSPRLFLNKTFPIILGHFYGFAKKKANVAKDQDDYLIDDWETNNLLIAGHFTPQGEPGPTSDFPLFQQVMPTLFNQPLTGQTHLGPLPGPFVCSVFDWHFDQAQIQPVRADINIAEAFVPGLKTGEYSTPGIDTDSLGAFYIDTHWRLTEPMDCDDVS